MPATKLRCCAFAALVPRAVRVGRPTAFASHAFDDGFALFVAALREKYVDAMPSEVYVWIDIFAINQHNPSAELYSGRVLALTIKRTAAVLLVLHQLAVPLTRLWCLFELGSTPPEKLSLLLHECTLQDLARALDHLHVQNASCGDGDRAMIIESIVDRHRSVEAFQQTLSLRLRLRPTSYESDLGDLLAHGDDKWQLDELFNFVCSDLQSGRHRLAIVASPAGYGKSTLAAALSKAPVSGASDAPLLVDACHFFKKADSRRQDGHLVMRALAYQLAMNKPEFGVQLSSLHPTSADTESAVWSEPLKAFPGTERVVLLLDGLDEALDPDEPERSAGRLSDLLDSINYTKRPNLSLHPLSIIVTTRPDPHVLRMLDKAFDNFDKKEFALDELRALDGAESGAAAAHTSGLMRRLKGMLADSDLHSMEDAYASVFRAPIEAHTRRALSILLTARRPPALAVLHAMDALSACRLLPCWGTLFVERDNCVHMLHKSLADWLLQQEGMVDVKLGNTVWADELMRHLRSWLWPAPGVPAVAPPLTGSRIYADALPHLHGAGRTGVVRALLLRLPWLLAAVAERGVHRLRDDVAASLPSDGEDRGIAREALLRALNGYAEKYAYEKFATFLAEELPTLLVGSLQGVLAHAPPPDVVALYSEVYAWRSAKAWLRPLHATLPRTDDNDPLRHAPHAHDRYFRALVELDDGAVATGSADGTVRVWRPAIATCEHVLEGHTGAVTGLASPGAGRLVSSSSDGTLRVWRAATGYCEHVLAPDTCSISAVAALPCGRIVSCSADGTLRLWQPDSGECVRVLDRALSPVPGRSHTWIEGMPDGRVFILTWDALFLWEDVDQVGVSVRCLYTFAALCSSSGFTGGDISCHPIRFRALTTGKVEVQAYVGLDCGSGVGVGFSCYFGDTVAEADNWLVPTVPDNGKERGSWAYRRWGRCVEHFKFPLYNADRSEKQLVCGGVVAARLQDTWNDILVLTLPGTGADGNERVAVALTLDNGALQFYEVIPPI